MRASWRGSILLALGVMLLTRAQKATATTMRRPNTRLNPRTGQPIVQAGIHKLSRDELAALIARVGFSDEQNALAIALRESGGFADVTVDTRGMTAQELLAYWNRAALPEYSVGLWQINVLAHQARVPGATSLDDAAERLKDPEVNARVALALSQGGTAWGAWGGPMIHGVSAALEAAGLGAVDLQRALNAAGAQPPLVLDGRIGPVTVAQIRFFQAAHGLPVDGIAGPRTVSKLAPYLRGA